jgi:hypothetical protein
VPLDQVKAGNKITLQLRKLVLPQLSTKRAASPGSEPRKRLSWALARG